MQKFENLFLLYTIKYKKNFLVSFYNLKNIIKIAYYETYNKRPLLQTKRGG